MAGAHLIGSVPLQDAETVFRTLADQLGPWLARMPDGETGERSRWIWWQHEMLLRHPAMEIDPTVPPQEFRQWDGQLLRAIEMLRLKPGIDLSGVVFETGYAAAALASYAVFRKLRDVGRIPAGMRFQVCLPTPMASAYMYVSGPGRAAYLPVYERALRTALRDILNGIPHGDLSIQWDVCQEVLVFENYFPDRPESYAEDVLAELDGLGDAVPREVECGYHLCYGSPRDEHLVMPKDMGVLVAMTRGPAEGAAPATRFHPSARAEGPDGRQLFRAAARTGAAGGNHLVSWADQRERCSRRCRPHCSGTQGGARVRHCDGMRLGPEGSGPRSRPDCRA
jgi:hypothetical protein